jgi:hypothetical protein
MPMTDSFDPYYKWLGIHPKDQPPTHYRLLGLERFESDVEVIESAADRQMAHLRSFQVGKHGALSQQLLNKVAAAKRCLLDPAKKALYDETLRGQEGPRQTAHELHVAPTTALAVALPLNTEPLRAVVPVVQPSDDRARAARPLWQEPVVIAGLVGGSAIGLAVLGAILFVSIRARGTPEAVVGVATAPAIPSAAPIEIDQAPRRQTGQVDATLSEIRANEPGNPESFTSGVPQPLAPAVPVDRGPPQSPNTGLAPPQVAPPGSASVAVTPAEPVEAQPPADVPRIRYEIAGDPINLLNYIEPERDAVHGKWHFEQNVLVAPERLYWARLQIPIMVPDEYILTVEIAQPRGADILNLGLVAGGSQFIYCPSAFGKGGLFLLDGKEWHVNETSYMVQGVFHPGPNVITCLVHRKGVLAQVNRRTLVDWEGDFRRLTLQPHWRMPSSETLFLGTGGPRCDFTKIELQAIRSEGQP